MASKKLIALSMLCYALTGHRKIKWLGNEQFENDGRYPFWFHSLDEVNGVALSGTPECRLEEVLHEGALRIRIEFNGGSHFLPKNVSMADAIESAALKRYSHFAESNVRNVREYLQNVYRYLFNAVSRKGISGISDYEIDESQSLLKWKLGDFIVEADLNILIGPTAIEIYYNFDPAQYLLIVVENYGQFDTTHYFDLLLHSTSLSELRQSGGVLHLTKKQLLSNVTQLPITFMPKFIEKELSITILKE